ncbi:MAG: VWA domain-containing protein [Acidobacteriota bacterium]
MSNPTTKARSSRTPAAAFVVALLCSGSGIAAGQQPSQREANFSAEVGQVVLHVAVIDPRGREVPPLTADDFTVYDDGVEQDIDLFVTPSDAPIDVAMVLDSSSSMKPVETSARRAAITFLNRMGLDDCIYVLPFSDSSGPGRWGRSADPDLRAFIGSIRASGGTALNDAVLDGLAELERANANELVRVANEAEGNADAPRDSGAVSPAATAEARQGQDPGTAEQSAGDGDIVLPPRRTSLLEKVDSVVRGLDLTAPAPTRGCGEPLPPGTQTTVANARRKALLLLSDGADMDSEAGFYDALGAARAASVPVFPVAMGYAYSDPDLSEHLAELARATGGRLIENTRPGELGASYDQVVTLLRSYYLLGYDPGISGPHPSGGRARWHDVRVELRRPNFEALVRPGYYR